MNIGFHKMLTETTSRGTNLMLELKAIVNGFFKFAETTGVEIYNEFSLQHEMGIYLRSVLSDYKV